MTEDTSPENLRKFLESEDPALVVISDQNVLPATFAPPPPPLLEDVLRGFRELGECEPIELGEPMQLLDAKRKYSQAHHQRRLRKLYERKKKRKLH